MSNATVEAEGKAIAEALGVIYTGPQYHKGELYCHLFTDPLTQGTFAATNKGNAWARFFALREAFDAPLPDNIPPEWKEFTLRFRGNLTKAFKEMGWLPAASQQAIIHEAITFDPEDFELLPKEIDVDSAFPEGAESNLTAEEKAIVDRLIEAIPDENNPLTINYWRDMGDKMVYLEGWADECLAGTGFTDITVGGWRDKIEFMLKETKKVLIEKQEEGNRPLDVLIPKGRLNLIEGGFREFPAGERGFLYGVTWGVYSLQAPEGEAAVIRAKIKYFRQEEAKWRETAGIIAEKERGEAAFADAWTKADEFGAKAVELEALLYNIPAVHPLIIEEFPHPAPEEMELGGDIGKLKVPVPPPRGTRTPPKKPTVGVTVYGQPLTMEDYEKHWKPDGWKLLPIGPTSTWRQDWGEWEAIRDIVQNALDETEAYQFGYDDQGLWIADEGKGVAVADFLLGPPKLKPEYARGRFGEGLKIAALALLRLGFPIHIETVGREVWMVFLEQEINGKANMLAALWRHNGTKQGTMFHIIGYKGSAYEDRFAVNLQERVIWEGPSPVKVPKQRYNQLIDPYGQSRIFARDIYLREINSPYSYNLWGFDLAPDRHAPTEESDVWVDIGRLWCTVTREDLLEIFLQMVKQPSLLEAEESYNVNMDRWKMGEVSPGKHYGDLIEDNKEAWLKAWYKVMGENAVIRTTDRLDNLITHLGYQSVSINWYVRDTLAKAIPTDTQIKDISQEKLRETEVIPDEQLDARHMAHLSLARAINEKVFTYSIPPEVYAAIIPPASDRVRTAGMYGTSTQNIYIAFDSLYRGRDTVDAMVHEMAHHRQWRKTGEAEDLTPSHAEAMTYIAAAVIEDLARGAHPEVLKHVIW